MYIILGARQFKYEMNIRGRKTGISGMKEIQVQNTYNIMSRNRNQKTFSTHAKILLSYNTQAIQAKILRTQKKLNKQTKI